MIETNNHEIFELKEHEIQFRDLCKVLKNHPFDSHLKMCFPTNGFDSALCEVLEFSVPEESDYPKPLINISSDSLETVGKNFAMVSNQNSATNVIGILESNEKMLQLRDSLRNVSDNHTFKDVKDIAILCSFSLAQVSELCKLLQNSFNNEMAVALFLSAILHMDKPISITIASALVNSVIYPKVLEIKQNSCRNFLAAVFNFSETYSKAIIDELIINCLKLESLENSQLDVLLKMTKCNIPIEYVYYSIRCILEHSLPTENTFSVLQCLIERKCNCDQALQTCLATTLQRWSSTCNNNVKFIKLIICILTTYETELEDQQITCYEHIIKSNKTIMRKAAENKLRKLRRT